ncbi:MAG: divalent metal cation transporter [Flavobacteriia bacterium]|nr:divalent metal cation transporter [Flavobacteriia bacterium]
MFRQFLKNTGPGPFIAAAFIGPGTVTLCTLVGVAYGFQLLWAVLFALLAAIILQGMAVRIGILGQKSIIKVIEELIPIPWVQKAILILIFCSIMVGNTAYEAGNISGAALGLETVFGLLNFNLLGFKIKLYPLLIGLLVAGLLWLGKYKILERSLIFLVILMSLAFLFTAIGLGGIISVSIIITAAGVEVNELNNAADLALGLAPIFGDSAKYLLSVGLFSAGITSSITAPLAAAYVVCGCFGWSTHLQSARFQKTWAFVILIGVLFASTGFKFIRIIQFAQIANGILLPIIAGILVWIMNKAPWLGNRKNGIFQNLFGFLIVLLSLILSIRSLGAVFQFY